MRVKKFEAKNMKDALQMVKNELGPDAVILSARDNRKSFGLGGQASVEITAAVSENTLQKKRYAESRLTQGDRDKFQNTDARTQRQIINRMVENRSSNSQMHAGGQADPQPKERRPITSVSYIDIPDEEPPSPRRTHAMERAAGRNVRELLSDFDQDFDQWSAQPVRSATAQAPRSQAPAAAPQPPAAEAASENAISRIRSAAREAWQAGIFTAATDPLTAAPQTPPQAQQNDAEIASLKGEIDRLQKVLDGFKKVPQTFTTMHPGADFGISYDLSSMFQKLTAAGVTVDNAVEILQQAGKEIDPVLVKKPAIVDAWVARWFLNNIQVTQNPSAGRLHLFVGASGSGKTSSLVKFASQLVVKEKKKVAILSTDSFKVGAVDQLKIYCQILNVPFAVIRNRKDWEWVMSQLNHVDHILVDFPGLQLRDLEEIQLLRSLLPPEGGAPVACHLCMSATTKDGDAYETARRYKVAGFSDLVFANLDQSVQHGIIHNLQKKTGKPLHSFGIGNRIPEDFEFATKERVLDLIFKLTKLRRDIK